MSEVKRYDPMGYDRLSGYMQQHPEGDYVRHADYAALEAECERLRAQVSALQSDANSWQSGYDKGREDGAKAADGWKAQHARDSAELRRLCSERDALHAEAEALRAALLGLASVNPAERGIEWAKSYASDGLKGAGSELYARWLDTFKEAEALRAENARLQNALLEVTARRFAESWKKRTSDAALEQYLSAGIAQLEAERDKLAEVLGNVEREHEILRRMKNCEILRDRGSFGIAVMSDTHAIEWQALDKELQQLIDARRAALSELTP